MAAATPRRISKVTRMSFWSMEKQLSVAGCQLPVKSCRSTCCAQAAFTIHMKLSSRAEQRSCGVEGPAVRPYNNNATLSASLLPSPHALRRPHRVRRPGPCPDCPRRVYPSTVRLASSARPYRCQARASARRPAMAALLRRPAEPRMGRPLVSFLRQHLDVAELATISEVLHHQFLHPALLGRMQHLDRLQLGDLLQQSMLRLLRGFAFLLRFADLLRHFPDVRREQRCRLGQGLVIMPCYGDSS